MSGSVRAVLLYQPEEGGGLRRMEAALLLRPAGGSGADGAGPGPGLRPAPGGGGRALNPARCCSGPTWPVDVTALQPRERVCCQGVLDPESHGVQQRMTEQESYQLEAVQEKPFTFSEQVRLNVGQGEPVQLAACRAVPLCGRAASSAAS